MRSTFYYQHLVNAITQECKLLAILIDPEKFDPLTAASFLSKIPTETTHLFVGGSTVPDTLTERVVIALKTVSDLPVFIFPGAASQITEKADALLFLSLLSGDNPAYLVGQQVRAAASLKTATLEVIPTSYLLLDGGQESAVARVTQTKPMSQNNIEKIVHTALAGQLMGAKLIYLEAGSGASVPVQPAIIKAVKQMVEIPIIVGGGIKTQVQKEAAYDAGANMIVMGTVFEEN
ncbi:MAG: phosphoglycerol geranylgeranyltransferase [Patiriisocius sp.]|jgi:putative glycerol-1-phosphate prenyltransferase